MSDGTSHGDLTPPQPKWRATCSSGRILLASLVVDLGFYSSMPISALFLVVLGSLGFDSRLPIVSNRFQTGH